MGLIGRLPSSIPLCLSLRFCLCLFPHLPHSSTHTCTQTKDVENHLEDPANGKATQELGVSVAVVYVVATRWRCVAAVTIAALLKRTKPIGSLVLPGWEFFPLWTCKTLGGEKSQFSSVIHHSFCIYGRRLRQGVSLLLFAGFNFCSSSALITGELARILLPLDAITHNTILHTRAHACPIPG